MLGDFSDPALKFNDLVIKGQHEGSMDSVSTASTSSRLLSFFEVCSVILLALETYCEGRSPRIA